MDRLSVEDYYRAALDVLGESGSEALTINALCERLQVTKGSFYHHFGSMPAFVDALLLFWESESTERLTAIAKAQPDATLRIATLLEFTVSLPHASEAAIRAWARSNAEVNAVTVRVDRRRERHVTDAVVALGLDRTAARLLARMTINLLVGAQQREQPVDVKRLRQTFEELRKLIFLEADPKLVAHLVRATSG
ncbi:TetR/AcrR family transcriptional regulator [uncultured Jatrophihabitans sp.]|uniref:TetR/AcrR family transcriptional regulator n=1 Tax=uncultured Jatrophihabitans sp. TaxID=1610747 RepID=UPI0035CBD550